MILGAISMIVRSFVFACVAMGGVPGPEIGAAELGRSIFSFATSAQSDGQGNEVYRLTMSSALGAWVITFNKSRRASSLRERDERAAQVVTASIAEAEPREIDS